MAWRDLLEHCGAPSGTRWAVHVFGVTQPAKHIPGNYFHLASRQTVGMSDGHEAMPLLKSAFWEFAAIMSSAAIFGLWLVPLLFEGARYALGGSLFVLLLVIVSASAQQFLSPFVMRAVRSLPNPICSLRSFSIVRSLPGVTRCSAFSP